MDPNDQGSVSISNLQLAYSEQVAIMQAWMSYWDDTGNNHALDRVRTIEDLLESLWAHINETKAAHGFYSRFANADEYIAYENAILEPAAKAGRINFAKIKEQIDIVEYIGKFTELKQNGNKFVGRCPLPAHDDSTPSFYVYPETKSFYCFGCNVGGDVITFVQHHEARPDWL